MGAFTREQLGRAVAIDDGQHRSFAAPASRRMRARGPGERGDLNPARGAARQGRLNGAAGVIGVHVHRIATCALGRGRRDGDRVAQFIEPLTEVLDPVGLAAAQ